MQAATYIDQSRERVSTRFAETRRLAAIWRDAARLALAQPTPDLQDLAKQAHAAYKAEQERAISNNESLTPSL